MRILVCNRDYESHTGGDLVHIEQLSRALEEIGIERHYPRRYKDAEAEGPYNLAHLYHINFDWSWEWYKLVVDHNIPLVITPIFYPRQDLGISFKQMKEILGYASLVCPYTIRECEEISKSTGWDPTDNVRIMTPGVGKEFFYPGFNRNREGVLTVEAREGAKNAYKVEFACKSLGLDYTIATGIPYKDMPKLYREHRVFVTASKDDRWGHTVTEALASGCRCIGSTRSWGRFPGLQLMDPWNQDWLESSIKWAYHAVDWDWTPNVWVRDTLDWRNIARDWKRIYQECLEVPLGPPGVPSKDNGVGADLPEGGKVVDR